MENIISKQDDRNRILFCLFWIGMLIAVIYSRTAQGLSLISDSIGTHQFDLGFFTQVLTTLLLISSFLERALEVYALTFRKKGEDRLNSNLRKLTSG